MGHEFMGEVVEVGSAVRTLVKGDRVVSAFTTSWCVVSLPTESVPLSTFSSGSLTYILAVASASTASKVTLRAAKGALSLAVRS